jgi:predicted phosphodiesterase
LTGDPRRKIVSCHHPLMEGPPGSPNPTINGDAAFFALAQAGADVVLSGHVHVPFDITHEVAGRPLRMIGAGTLSTRLRGAVPSYNVLCHCAERGLALELRTLPPA